MFRDHGRTWVCVPLQMAATIKANAELAAAREELENTKSQLAAKDETVSVIQVQLAARVHDVAHFKVCVCVCACVRACVCVCAPLRRTFWMMLCVCVCADKFGPGRL